MAKASAFGGKRNMGPRERSELFVSRQKRQLPMSFAALDPVLLVAALDAALLGGATLSFAPAQGGIGCTVRVYRGDYADTEFAGSPEELTELLTLVIAGLGGTSEDLIASTRAVLIQRGFLK